MSVKGTTMAKGDRVQLEDLQGIDADDPREIVKEAMFKLTLASSVIEHELMSIAICVITEDIDTMAVALGGDGVVRLLINPEFTTKLGADGAAFVLSHEAYHIIYGHLYAGEALRNDECFRIAEEIIINDRVMKHLKAPSLPLVDGKPSGMDPAKLYAKYRAAKKDKGEDPVSRDQFLSTDLACRSYIAEIPKPPQSRNDFCSHPQAGDTGDDGGPGGGIDPSEAGTLVEGVLDSVMQRALQGNQSAKDALLELGETVGEDHPLWGNLGLGALRGETVPTQQVKFWEYFLTQALASLMQPGCRMVYPRKLSGLREIYKEQGSDIPFLPMGREPERNVSIYVDTSGSMGQELIERVSKLVGDIPGATVKWNAFDADIYEFEPGEPLRGGGGTSFDIVQKHVDELEDEPDCVLVLTDGYAPHIHPTNSDAWIWLVTAGGDTWPMDNGMECIEVDI